MKSVTPILLVISWKLQKISLFTTALLCFGLGAPLSRAVAQDTPKPAQKADAPQAFPVVAEDAIDAKQPLKPSFVVNVTVADEPEPSGTYVVEPTGHILLHIAEALTPIHVNGRTPAEAADIISAYLKRYIKGPRVTVTILSVPHLTVTIGGAVRNAGALIVAGSSTLVDVLSKVQWLENADLGEVRILRREVVKGEEKKKTLTLHVDTYIRPEAGKALRRIAKPRASG